MRYATMHKCILWLTVSLLAAGCAKQSPQESEPTLSGERSIVLKLAGDVKPFDSPTKAPESFTPSSSNVLYLYLYNSNGDSITGKGTYNEGNAIWLFTYEGSFSQGLTSGDIYGYLFENNWNRYGSGADEYIQLGPRVPVYESTRGSFSFSNDTLFVNAQFSPASSRISFTQDLADGYNKEIQNLGGIRYYSRFYPQSFMMDSSAEEFYGGSASNQTYYYGNALFPNSPVLYYQTNGFRFVKRFQPSTFQAGYSGYIYLPQNSNEYEGWKKYSTEYNFYINDWRQSLRFNYIPCGSFFMGGMDASPVHEVTITESFYMMDMEVDETLWYLMMREPEDYSESVSPIKPVTGKSWEEIQAFIAKMESTYKCHFRLPTEAEWEYAARGGIYESINYEDFYTYSGSDIIDDVAWYSGNSNNTIHYLQDFRSNVLGLYNMSGNAAELCSDWYGSYKDEAVTDPIGPENGTYRVVRGGSYAKDAEWCTNTHRGSEADYSPAEIGFRLVMIPPSFPD